MLCFGDFLHLLIGQCARCNLLLGIENQRSLRILNRDGAVTVDIAACINREGDRLNRKILAELELML